MPTNIKLTLFCLFLFSFSSLLSQHNNLTFWDIPLNSNHRHWKASDTHFENWEKFSFDDTNWSTPVETEFTNYPPFVWTSDPLTSPPNTNSYYRGKISFKWGTWNSIEQVLIQIMCNDDFQVYFNETFIGEDLTGVAGPVKVYDVTSIFNSNEENLIAIKGINTLGYGYIQALVRVYFSDSTSTYINTQSQKLDNFRLEQNHPNPFNPSTTIQYSIQKSSNVNINIYNNTGQLVRSFVNQRQLPGQYSLIWNGTNERMEKVSSGQYYYQVKIDNRFITKKMLLVK